MGTRSRFTVVGVAAATAICAGIAGAGAAVATPVHAAVPVSAAVVSSHSAGDGSAAGAVEWYQAHMGSTAWQHYCEMAAENSYGATGVWPSAIAHWNGGDQHPGDTNPPLGAFVYWNISAYGHVGISDGQGGAYATSVNGAIGHITSLSYFSNYLGWTPPGISQR